MILNIFKCPVCGELLVTKDKSLACRNGHSFDRARDNHVNLLPGNKKNSKDPGDSKEMMECRRAFLDKGYYKEFSDMLCEIVAKHADTNWKAILDSGCGEGYFIANLRKSFHHIPLDNEEKRDLDKAREIFFYGMDISKHAIRFAAKRDKDIQLFVGSSFDIPIVDNSVDCVVRNFAPGDSKEFGRILRPEGRLVIITPGPEHLFELKAALYDKPRRHEQTDIALAGFKLISSEELKYQIELSDHTDIRNLVSMTPYYWSIKPEMRNNLDRIAHLQTGLHFEFNTYVKE